MKFLAFNVDFSSSSPDPLGSSRPAQGGRQKRLPLKSGYFTTITSCSVNTVADRHRHAAYHNKHLIGFLNLSTSMTLNDLELSQKGFLVNFSQYLDAAHISILNCDEMAGVRPRQPAYKIFSIKRRFQQSKSRSPRFMELGAGGSQRLQRFRAAQVYIIHKVAPQY